MADSEDLLEGVPEMPEGKIPIQAPPNQAEAAGIGNVLAMVIPMMGSMGVMVFMAISQATSGDGQSKNPTMMMMAGGMVFAMVAMVGFNVYRQVLPAPPEGQDSARRIPVLPGRNPPDGP